MSNDQYEFSKLKKEGCVFKVIGYEIHRCYEVEYDQSKEDPWFPGSGVSKWGPCYLIFSEKHNAYLGYQYNSLEEAKFDLAWIRKLECCNIYALGYTNEEITKNILKGC